MTPVENPTACEEPTSNPSIESQVLAKLRGRLCEFFLHEEAGRLVLSGTARSYHVKQLAQQEVMGLTSRPIHRNRIEVIP